MFRLEPIPRFTPRVSGLDGQVGNITAKEIASDFGKSFERERGNLSSGRGARPTQVIEPIKELVDRRREGDE